MTIAFDGKEVLSLSDKELFNIWKRSMKKYNIFYKVSMTFIAFVFVAFVLMLFQEWDWSFVFVGLVWAYVYVIYNQIPIKVRENLLKTPAYRFEDEHFYVGEKQLSYSDIELFEMGGDFARIKMGKYKLVLIFKGRDKEEMDKLVAKLKANAKQYKEV